MELTLESMTKAIERAKAMELIQGNGGPIPEQPATRVFFILEEILARGLLIVS
jgi:hypothetical protein